MGEEGRSGIGMKEGRGGEGREGEIEKERGGEGMGSEGREEKR